MDYTLKLTYTGLINDQFTYQGVLKFNNTTFEFPFKTGIGWLSAIKGNEHEYLPLRSDELLIIRRTELRFRDSRIVFRKIPNDLDVLSCLKTDVFCGQMSHIEFCDELGYNKDSIEDLKTYMTCNETASKLRGFDFSIVPDDY